MTVWSRCRVGPLGATSDLVNLSGAEGGSIKGCALVSVKFFFEVELVARYVSCNIGLWEERVLFLEVWVLLSMETCTLVALRLKLDWVGLLGPDGAPG